MNTKTNYNNMQDKLERKIVRSNKTVTPVNESKFEVSFAKSQPQAEPEEHEVETRQERRDAMKRASEAERRAMEMEKNAKERLKKAEAFEQLKSKGDADPIELAKALGFEPNEFLRKYQNSMFNVQEPEPTKQETSDERMARYDRERQEERKQSQELNESIQRREYIKSNILPALQDQDRFELLYKNGIEQAAENIYDLMNAEFQETKTVWDPAEVAQQIEDKLNEDFQEALKHVKGMKRYSKMFKEEEEDYIAPATLAQSNKTTDSDLSESLEDHASNPYRKTFPKNKSISGMSSLPVPSVIQGQNDRISLNNREARLKRAIGKK